MQWLLGKSAVLIVNHCYTLRQGLWYWLGPWPIFHTRWSFMFMMWAHIPQWLRYPVVSWEKSMKWTQGFCCMAIIQYFLPTDDVSCTKTNGNYLNLPFLSMSSVGPINFNLFAIWLLFQLKLSNQCNNQADSWKCKHYLSVMKRKAVLMWQKNKKTNTVKFVSTQTAYKDDQTETLLQVTGSIIHKCIQIITT